MLSIQDAEGTPAADPGPEGVGDGRGGAGRRAESSAQPGGQPSFRRLGWWAGFRVLPAAHRSQVDHTAATGRLVFGGPTAPGPALAPGDGKAMTFPVGLRGWRGKGWLPARCGWRAGAVRNGFRRGTPWNQTPCYRDLRSRRLRPPCPPGGGHPPCPLGNWRTGRAAEGASSPAWRVGHPGAEPSADHVSPWRPRQVTEGSALSQAAD